MLGAESHPPRRKCLNDAKRLSTQHPALSTDSSTQQPALNKKPSLMTEQPPPIFKTWPRLYAVVLGALALEVILFAILTRSFH